MSKRPPFERLSNSARFAPAERPSKRLSMYDVGKSQRVRTPSHRGRPVLRDRPTDDVMIEAAAFAREGLLSTATRVTVGASLLTVGDHTFTACSAHGVPTKAKEVVIARHSVVALSPPLHGGLCAERLAVTKATSAAKTQFVALYLFSESDTHFYAPCPSCRCGPPPCRSPRCPVPLRLPPWPRVTLFHI